MISLFKKKTKKKYRGFKQGKVPLWGPSEFLSFLNLLVLGFQIWKAPIAGLSPKQKVKSLTKDK
jgi:hypothetical protein